MIDKPDAIIGHQIRKDVLNWLQANEAEVREKAERFWQISRYSNEELQAELNRRGVSMAVFTLPSVTQWLNGQGMSPIDRDDLAALEGFKEHFNVFDELLKAGYPNHIVKWLRDWEMAPGNAPISELIELTTHA